MAAHRRPSPPADHCPSRPTRSPALSHRSPSAHRAAPPRAACPSPSQQAWKMRHKAMWRQGGPRGSYDRGRFNALHGARRMFHGVDPDFENRSGKGVGKEDRLHRLSSGSVCGGWRGAPPRIVGRSVLCLRPLAPCCSSTDRRHDKGIHQHHVSTTGVRIVGSAAMGFDVVTKNGRVCNVGYITGGAADGRRLREPICDVLPRKSKETGAKLGAVAEQQRVRHKVPRGPGLRAKYFHRLKEVSSSPNVQRRRGGVGQPPPFSADGREPWAGKWQLRGGALVRRRASSRPAEKYPDAPARGATWRERPGVVMPPAIATARGRTAMSSRRRTHIARRPLQLLRGRLRRHQRRAQTRRHR